MANPAIRYQVFEPRVNAELGLIVFPNEIAGGLQDDHGARAQVVADTVGTPVLAYERLFSTAETGAHFSPSIRQYINANYAHIHAATAHALDRIIGREDSQAPLLLLGQSFGAAEVIGLTRTEILPVQELVATDPPGLRAIAPFKAELWDYGYGMFASEKDKPDDEESHKQLSDGYDRATMLKRILANTIAFSGVLRTTHTLDDLLAIAASQPTVSGDVVFPEHTFTATTELHEQIIDDIDRIRSLSGHDFRARILPGTYHTSFNNPELLGQLAANRLI
jgi:hypothetical protein